MARMIKETPILYGEEARLFELRAATVKPFPKERIEKILADYEFMRKRGVNCTFWVCHLIRVI